MKNLILSSVLYTLYICTASAQVAILDYMRVNPQNEASYLEVEKQWKKVHAERIRVGTIEAWYLYRVRYAGTNSPYQYVTISIYKQLDDSENLYFEGVFDKAWKGEDQNTIQAATLKSREMTRSEVLTWVDGTELDYMNPATYLYMNFINVNPGDENRYIEIEKYVWKPMHEALVKENKMSSWSLWNLWFYSHRNYRYVTMNAFYEYDDLDSYNYSEVFEKVHQGKDLNMMYSNTTTSRTSFKTELWELVDYIASEK